MLIKLKKDIKLDSYFRGYIKTELYKKNTIFNADWDGSLYNVNIKNGPSICILKEDVVRIKKK
jgi:hypothetical protein